MQRPPHAFCNITHGAEHSSAPMADTGVLPALARNSVMVGICQPLPPPGRVAHPVEHYSVQGFPALLGAPGDPGDAAILPLPERLVVVGCPGALIGREQRSLAGDGMHTAAVGAWLLFALAVAASP